jgi:hypothetical protein
LRHYGLGSLSGNSAIFVAPEGLNITYLQA